MRIALISDLHIRAASERFGECDRVLSWIGRDIEERQVDLVAIGGDVFDTAPMSADMLAAARHLVDWAHTAPVVGVYGNHDPPLALATLSMLDSLYGITFHDEPTVTRYDDTQVACLPWPRHGSAIDGRTHEDVRDVLRGLGSDMDDNGSRRVFLGHVQLVGSRTSGGQPLVGKGVEVGLDDLALVGAEAYLLGHVHMTQEITIAGSPCVYPGSPYRTSYGEPEDKHYAIVDLNSDDGTTHVTYVRTPARPMHLLEATWDAAAGEFHVADIPDVDGADVRLRYGVDVEQHDLAKKSAMAMRGALIRGGAASVKIDDRVTVEARVRAPELARAASLEDKLVTLWRSRDSMPGQATAARLLGPRLTELQEEP